MGQYDEQDEIIQWSTDLTPTERENRRPVQIHYGVGRSTEEISAAVDRARHSQAAAEFVLHLVEVQAVFAMNRSGSSVRDIAEATGISKSRVGRMIKNYERQPYAAATPPMGTIPQDLIRAAWES